MAKKKSTRTHVSPGIYFKETEVAYSTNSLGITTLGLAGETVKGPAFQPISISDWREYQTYFGGTNPEKFRGSQYPKYELPYIAKEYLKQSKQLEVVRTLGLSGVNAGPAWVITATKQTCGSGYEYTQQYDSDKKAVVYPNFNSTLSTCFNGQETAGEDGIYEVQTTPISYVAFSKPEGKIEDTKTLQDEIGVIDKYENINCDIFYIDDSDEYFSTLPTGLQNEFGSYSELKKYAETVDSLYKKIDDPSTIIHLDEYEKLTPAEQDTYTLYQSKQDWGGAFLYINLENTITNESTNHGYLAVQFKLDSSHKAIVLNYNLEDTLYDKNNHSYDDFTYDTFLSGSMGLAKAYDDGVSNYKYIIIPKYLFDNIAKSIYSHGEYIESRDFTISKINSYHYGFTNENLQGEKLLAQTGNTYDYQSNTEAKNICLSDADGEYSNMVVAILRSRGEHKKSVPSGTDECGNTTYTYDGIDYYAKNITLTPMTTLELGNTCNPGYNTTSGDFNVDTDNYGRFNIEVDYIKGCDICGIDSWSKNTYAVSLNPSDKNYITTVLGTDPEIGTAEIYVEELYDVALEQLIYSEEINAINSEVAMYPAVTIIPSHESVTDILTMDASNLSKKYVGKRYLYTYSESMHDDIQVRVTTDGGTSWSENQTGIVGHIYTVMYRNNNGKKEYFYGEYRNDDGSVITTGKKFTDYLLPYHYGRDVVSNNYVLTNCVKVESDGCYYIYKDWDNSDTANEGDVEPITLDFNNYKEEYRYSSTPWFVSELKGSGEDIILHKLFRLHTISDGDTSSREIKVSIENIDPDAETFDVVIRSFYDSDINPDVLERFGKCCLTPGESNYLGLKIGTIDGTYVSQSAYVTVEIAEGDAIYHSVPCGFLGYPVRNYSGIGIYEINDGTLSTNIKKPYLRYNTSLDEEVKVKKQYFGMSDITGIDEDILSYKGVEAYGENPEYLTPCFHLDSRILNGTPTIEKNGVYYVEDYDAQSGDPTAKQSVNVDGITGYTWVTVSRLETTSEGIEPKIGESSVMEGTIYEDKTARKFTACFYGGWDGWDYYRTSRSNGDDYRYNKYKGSINSISGHGTMFNVIKNPEYYGFDSKTKVITSDYYAYLAAFKQLDNPKTVAINLFATPGIDYVNQTLLVEDVIEMVEEERGDALYIVTTPDKPFGASDAKSEMYTPTEVVSNLEDTDIDTNYACTYYPWEQYYDSDNNQYIYLPITLDVVRNMAYTDNIAYPWYASAGWNRGDISGVSPKRKLKLAEQDTLYEGRINFVNSFAKEGDKVWGDKNLQIHDGIMNRISKRRLLIRLKTLLSTACVGLLFDPNDPSMVDTFKSTVKSVLNPIMTNRGITDYKIEVDDSAEARDRLELPAKIWIKPTQMLEYIDIELVVTPQGTVWS